MSSSILKPEEDLILKDHDPSDLMFQCLDEKKGLEPPSYLASRFCVGPHIFSVDKEEGLLSLLQSSREETDQRLFCLRLGCQEAVRTRCLTFHIFIHKKR